MIHLTNQLAATIGTAPACQALDVPRTSYYRAQSPGVSSEPLPELAPVAKASSPRALSTIETAQVLQVLNSERFQDQAVREVYATLLDEGTYLCSWRTMYRLLDRHQEVRERRNLLSHPAYAKPELLATAPKRLWSWDITKLRGPTPGSYYCLYVLLDVFSRYVVGWMIAERESEDLAQELIQATYTKQGIPVGQLAIHADNGSAMISKTIAQLLIDLGVTKTHSRPHVSDDNPYSEAQFKTMKYRPNYPARFGCLADARAWAQVFFTWYNHEHHHTGLGLLTPAVVHHAQADTVLQLRQETLQTAYAAHPERFVKGSPRAARPPAAVWINSPKPAIVLDLPIRH